MNSSTSSSKSTSWRGFSITLLAATAVIVSAIVGLAYVVDPYDTGRSPLFSKAGVRPQGPRTANPSRGRDPVFNAMISGNSRIQMLSPEKLNEATGLNFVQLSVPGSGPKEHLTLIEWFLRHRQEPPKALVVSVDDLWCTSDPALPNDKPFPFWLYSTDPLEYARGLVRYDILEEMPRRFTYVFGKKAERARPDGYWDYEPEYIRLGYTTKPEIRKRLEQTPHAKDPRLERDPMEGRRQFPAIERLKDIALSLPKDTPLVLIMPPAYKNLMPLPNTEAAFIDRACKTAAASVAQVHGKTAVVDWRVDRPENRDPELFFDMMHYRHPIARAMEADVSEALRRLR
ncbi:hypothetical protein [Microvirga terricola]|uniref:SGNH/GDSL hydrolase family protein n=1 Tax=Microvirga terricola TaxID=2719797 RepID=A0ABX0VC53_9HYPH|nr:hypothetical protein [Microvirga terricola]NIX76535.1 hypothetical protein [Microvirga terricola]